MAGGRTGKNPIHKGIGADTAGRCGVHSAGINSVVPVGLRAPDACAPNRTCRYGCLQLLHYLVWGVEPAEPCRAVFGRRVVAAIGVIVTIKNINVAGFPDLNKRLQSLARS